MSPQSTPSIIPDTTSKPDIRPKTPVPIWHSFHNDPSLGSVIKSKDGILFTASGHALKRESTLFAGMLTNLPNNQAEPIPLDFPADAIVIFLDCYMTTVHRTYDDVDFHILHEYRNLILYLDCDRLIGPINSAYDIARQKEPLEWLRAASRDNDLSDAAVALAWCGEMSVAPASLATRYHAGKIVAIVRPEWRHALLGCLFHHSAVSGLAEISWPNEHWVRVFKQTVLADARDAAYLAEAGN